MKLRAVKSWDARAMRFLFWVEQWFEEFEDDDTYERAGWYALPKDDPRPFDNQSEAVRAAQEVFDKQGNVLVADFGVEVVAEFGP